MLSSAITGHASELILRSLAERGRHLDLSPAIREPVLTGVVGAQLASAADALSQAWPAFRAIARHWDTISTGSGAH